MTLLNKEAHLLLLFDLRIRCISHTILISSHGLCFLCFKWANYRDIQQRRDVEISFIRLVGWLSFGIITQPQQVGKVLASYHLHSRYLVKVLASYFIHSRYLGKVLASYFIHSRYLGKVLASYLIHRRYLGKVLASYLIYSRYLGNVLASYLIYSWYLGKVLAYYHIRSRQSTSWHHTTFHNSQLNSNIIQHSQQVGYVLALHHLPNNQVNF